MFLDPSEQGFKLPGFTLTRTSDRILLRARPKLVTDSVILFVTLLPLPLLLGAATDRDRAGILVVSFFLISLVWPYISNRRALRRATDLVHVLERTLVIESGHGTNGRPALEVDGVAIPARDIVGVVMSKDPNRRITDDTPSSIGVYLITRHHAFLLQLTSDDEHATRVAAFIAHHLGFRIRQVDSGHGASIPAAVLPWAHFFVSALLLILAVAGVHLERIIAWVAYQIGTTLLLHRLLKRLHRKSDEAFAVRVGVEPPATAALPSSPGPHR